ncbi:hypothetical protein [Rathayibacter sp. VKM Ac-2928]|uniref:hypothetical protein n=1 Tax=Rathayibacter sp. VKM Ac-2928 TaxID=2929479 RepID=UPI001FB564FA|nr:hypothetical protein [Rathayibacter sp. VKM Ac-2928]MCJ1683053.1 hypothetical protein [Rathayibacter sp. VKM Ac-2928]
MEKQAGRAVERTHFDANLIRRASAREFGGQIDWYWAVPDMVRSLAAPGSVLRVPALPCFGDEHSQSLGYWGALHYLVMYRLGWAHPHRGFQWWYDNGKPTEDSTLALIKDVWDEDGALDVYVAWLVNRQPVLGLLDAESGSAATSNGENLSARWSEWLALRKREGDNFENFGPDGDGLHLTRSLVERGNGDPSAVIMQSDPSQRRAVLVSSAMDSWYHDLIRVGNRLPVKGVASWKVDVFVKPVGYLGTFRRSLSTDLWFTGRHRIHQLGN